MTDDLASLALARTVILSDAREPEIHASAECQAASV